MLNELTMTVLYPVLIIFLIPLADKVRGDGKQHLPKICPLHRLFHLIPINNPSWYLPYFCDEKA